MTEVVVVVAAGPWGAARIGVTAKRQRRSDFASMTVNSGEREEWRHPLFFIRQLCAKL